LGHRQRIPFEILRMERLPRPPYEEQCRISEYLDHERFVDDNLILNVHKSIRILQEYRTSLISAAVTGKIDVRKEVS